MMTEGTWPKNDIRRAFVAGASWWQYIDRGFTMWSNERRRAEEEAEKRYGSQPTESEEKDSVIQTIADLIVSEAANRDSDDICRTIYDVNLLVRMRVMEMINEIKEEEREG